MEERRMPLEHLFDAELTYRLEMAPLARHGEGQLVGSGDGSVHGRRVRGALRWTLLEWGGELVCTMKPILAVRTEDGASIGIEGRGYAHRASRTSQLWRVAATLLFSADEESYAWLDGALGGGKASSTPASTRPATAPSSRRPQDRMAGGVPDPTPPRKPRRQGCVPRCPGFGGPTTSDRSGAAASGAAPDDSHRQGRRRASWPDRGRPAAVAGVVIRS
jgi:hypothetical protein